MAEGVGFEPTVPTTRYNALAGRPDQPLSHPSIMGCLTGLEPVLRAPQTRVLTTNTINTVIMLLLQLYHLPNH